MANGSQSTCKWGLDDLHRQLVEGNNAPETRWWLKAVLFNCTYAREPCGYRKADPVCVCGVELSQHHWSDPVHNFVSYSEYYGAMKDWKLPEHG